MNKLCTLAEAISLVHDGDCVGLGGNTLNRAPMAAVFELIRQGRKNLRVVKTAGAMDVDALCLGGCAGIVDAGFVSYESQYGLAQGDAPRGTCTTAAVMKCGISAFCSLAENQPSPTMRSAVTITLLAARERSTSSYSGPSKLALPCASATCA